MLFLVVVVTFVHPLIVESVVKRAAIKAFEQSMGFTGSPLQNITFADLDHIQTHTFFNRKAFLMLIQARKIPSLFTL